MLFIIYINHRFTCGESKSVKFQKLCPLLFSANNDSSLWRYKKEWLQKTVNFGIFLQLSDFIFALKVWQMLWSYTKNWDITVWRRLGRIINKNLFTQTMLDKIFGKLDRSRKLVTASILFLTAITKILFLEQRLGTRLYIHLVSRFS